MSVLILVLQNAELERTGEKRELKNINIAFENQNTNLKTIYCQTI